MEMDLKIERIEVPKKIAIALANLFFKYNIEEQ